MLSAFQVDSSTTPVWGRPARRWKLLTAETKDESTLASFLECHRPRRCWTMRTLTPFIPQLSVLVDHPRGVIEETGCR